MDFPFFKGPFDRSLARDSSRASFRPLALRDQTRYHVHRSVVLWPGGASWSFGSLGQGPDGAATKRTVCLSPCQCLYCPRRLLQNRRPTSPDFVVSPWTRLCHLSALGAPHPSCADVLLSHQHQNISTAQTQSMVDYVNLTSTATSLFAPYIFSLVSASRSKITCCLDAAKALA